MGGLKNPAQGADNTKSVFQIPVGLPSLERGRVSKNFKYSAMQLKTIEDLLNPYNFQGTLRTVIWQYLNIEICFILLNTTSRHKRQSW